MADTIEWYVVYKGRSGETKFLLSRVVGTPIDIPFMNEITKFEVHYKGEYYASDDQNIEADIYPATFELGIKLGLITGIEVGRDPKAELILYNSANTEGVVIATVPIKVLGDAIPD